MSHDDTATGTHEVAPSQGAFIGKLAIGLMAFVILCALLALVAGLMG